MERKIILSGSFNPLHEGHFKLLEVAARYTHLFLETYGFDMLVPVVVKLDELL